MTQKTFARALAVIASVAVSLGITEGGGATVQKRVLTLRATLSPAQHALGASHARGRLSGTLTVIGTNGRLQWTLSYSGLTGTATITRIDLGPSGRTLIPLCAPCHSGESGSSSGPFGKHSPTLRAIVAVHTYVNVQTARNPKGELRGYVHVVAAKAG